LKRRTNAERKETERKKKKRRKKKSWKPKILKKLLSLNQKKKRIPKHQIF
jgi:hypothetical protein